MTEQTQETYLFDLGNVQQRDTILFGEPIAWSQNQIVYYKDLDLESLDWLIANGHADPTDRQNCAPSIQEIRDFMAAHVGEETDFQIYSSDGSRAKVKITAHGYAVSPNRSDYRISIEGVEVWNLSQACLDDYLRLFRTADDFSMSEGHAYCWFD